MRRTRRALVAGARRLTVERGLAGFTVDELCAGVGISRRSFFNYFASKDDAVLGTPARDPLEAFGEEFVAGGSAPDGPPLLTALQELVVRSFALLEGPPDRALLLDVLRREPVLLQRLTETMDRRLADLTELIARRQGCGDRDPFPGVAAAVLAHLAGHTVHELLETRPAGADPDEAPPLEEFAELLARNVRLAGTLLCPVGTAPAAGPDAPSSTAPDPSATSPDTEGSP